MFPCYIFFVWGLCALSVFYMSNWEEYHTEVLRTSIGGFGLTECQYMIIIAFTMNGLTGGSIASYKVCSFGALFFKRYSTSGV